MSRILITGLATYWGGRLAKLLEADPDVELIVGVDREEPGVELERTEFVRVREDYAALRRIVDVARIDTILHTHLVVDSTSMSGRRLHENNVIGTMSLLAAAAATGSSVRRLVVKSSTLVYGAGKGDPQIFRERTARSNRASTRVEKSLLEVEDYVRDFADDNPHVDVTLFRMANVVGPDVSSPMQLSLRMRAIPAVFGFDPLIQVVHVDDASAALAYAVRHELPGVFNVAGDGMVPWSEVRALAGKPALWLPPVGTEAAASVLRRTGVIDLPPEFLALLRYGRGVDNVRLQDAGFRYQFTTVAAIRDVLSSMRIEKIIGGRTPPEFRYRDDLENFLHRHGA